MIETEEKSDSLDEMLRQIKKIMSEDMVKESSDDKINTKPESDDVLELLESSIVQENTASAATNDANKKDAPPAQESAIDVNSGDVLQNIDDLLGEKKTEQASEPKKDPLDDIFKSMASDGDKKNPETPPLADTTKLADAAPFANPEIVPAQLTPSSEDKKELTVIDQKEEVVADKPSQEKPIENMEEGGIEKEEKSKSSIKKVDRLVSSEVEAESILALKSLIKSVEKPLSDGLSFRSGVTMEQLVIEMIKPKLSDWLDENLPSIVKHVVEKEVKRLIPKDDD